MRTALRTSLLLALASLLAVPAFALNAGDLVKINEVSYDPSESPEEPFEFIELYNAGATVVYLDGAAISDEGNNGTAEATFVFPGTVGGTTIPLQPGAYMLLVGDATGTTLPADYEFFGGSLTSDTDAAGVPNLTKTVGSGVDMLLGNSGDGVTLSTGVTTGSVIPCSEVVDGVSWEGGGTNDTTAMSSTVCTDPAPNAGYTNLTGEFKTLQRCPNASDTDNSTTDFIVAARTPRLVNGCNNSPPVITSLQYAPCYPVANAQVTLTCTVTDPNSDIVSVTAYYKLEADVTFLTVPMTTGGGDVYTANLPGQADQAHVQYYVEAVDGMGNIVKNPTTAPSFVRSYRVGLQTIANLQTPTVADSCLSSSHDGRACNVVGVVTHVAYEYSDNFFYIQQGTAANSGIKVFTGADSVFVPQFGDSVLISGYIDEYYCQTEVVMFANCAQVLGINRKVRPRQLASLAGINAEENESMLVKVQGPIDVTAAFDSTNLGKEFQVAVFADTAYVGDDTFYPDLVGYSPAPQAGWTLDDLTGVVGYRRTNTTPAARQHPPLYLRLEPRRDNDVNVTWTDVGDPTLDVVRAFNLRQNTPNPFNPVTTIEFAVPQPGPVQLRIYDVRGQVVRTLVDRDYAAPAHDRVVWDGRDEAGTVVPSGVYFYKIFAGSDTATRKMLLLK
jgi:hypothetical protein